LNPHFDYSEQKAGRSSAPTTDHGALVAMQRQKTKLLCHECQTLQAVTDVRGVKPLTGATAYGVELQCSHIRATCMLTRNLVSRFDELHDEPVKRDPDTGDPTADIGESSGN
jgi:hypothetical protein